MGNIFKDIGKGISKAVSGIGKSVSNVVKNPGQALLPLAMNFLAPGAGIVGNSLLSRVGGQLATSFLGKALSGGGGGGQQLGGTDGSGGAGLIGQVFPGGQNSDQLIKLMSLFGGEKPEPPKLPKMEDLTASSMKMPFMAELQNLIKNNPNQQILPQLLARVNDNSTKQMIDKQIGAPQGQTMGMIDNALRRNPTSYLDSAIGALGQNKNRIADTTTGYGPDRMKLMRENTMSDLAELFDTSQKKVSASMAARGLTGGVMSNAQNLAMKDNQKVAQRALNDLQISDAEAERTDRWTKEGLMAQNADQTASAYLQGGGMAEDAIARLLGLRGQTEGQNQDNAARLLQLRQGADDTSLKAAGMYSDVAQRGIGNVMDAAKLGSAGVQNGMQLFGQGLDKYRIDSEAWQGLFSALGGNAAQPFSQPQTTIQPPKEVETETNALDLASLFSNYPKTTVPDLQFKNGTQTPAFVGKYGQNASDSQSSSGSKYFTDPGSRFYPVTKTYGTTLRR